MDQPVGHTAQLRLYPIRPIWSVGSGWAALSGVLAAGIIPFSFQTLLGLILAWLLADPILGVVWDTGVGDLESGGHSGIWRRLLRPRLPDSGLSVQLLPYTQAGSPGYRLARHVGRVRGWWTETFWPEAGREFAALLGALGLALLLGVVLGQDVLILVLVSVLLSWLAAHSEKREQTGQAGQSTRLQKDITTLWHALGEFGIPWLIGVTLLGGPSLPAALLGICYAITYFGLIQDNRSFWLIGASQATAAFLLAGLRHPVAAGATAVLLMPQWGLHAWAASAESASDGRPAASRKYRRYVQPFVIASMLLAALGIAS